MKLILSSSYLEKEMSVIFGVIPPSFVPFENKRLYERQIEFLKSVHSDPVFITLPLDYTIDQADQQRLDTYNHIIHRSSADLSIGAVIHEVLDRYKPKDVEILYGDTLILNESDYNATTITVSKNDTAYDWHISKSEFVWCGHFYFSSPGNLKSALAKNNNDFFDAVNLYEQNNNVTYKQIKREEWLDFGHIKTFFKSKKQAKTARVFNSTRVVGNILEKKSYNFEKLIAEFDWLSSIKGELSLHIPRVIDCDRLNKSYKIEYTNSLTISELLVFGNIDQFTRINIFDNLNKILILMMEEGINLKEDSIQSFLECKYNKRQNEIAQIAVNYFGSKDTIKINGLSYPSIHDIHKICLERISKKSISARVHGDFCASNLLYNPLEERVYMIDPRGVSREEKWQLNGDLRYDFAKLAHSIIGNYDHIIAGNYRANGNDVEGFRFEIFRQSDDEWRSLFTQMYSSFGISYTDLMSIMITLFITMVPLHTDNVNRQLAFLLNACVLYGDLDDYNTNGWS